MLGCDFILGATSHATMSRTHVLRGLTYLAASV